MRFGLLGQKLSHSYSPQIHKSLGGYAYDLIQVAPEELPHFLRTADFSGINVTIPYKKAVLPYCANLSPQAARLGAVNTIIKQADGTLWGHNTDYFGFREMVHISGLNVENKKVLVLGSGGAGVTAAAVLTDLGAKVICISRNGENNYNNLNLHADASVIVNATPVGMYPHNGVSPVSVSDFSNLEGVLDLIYNPAKTDLLLQAEENGIVALNGLYMLVSQAKESAEYFSGKDIPNECITNVYRQLKQQMENIVLIGMPGSGKTTIGRIIAQKLNRKFVDTDLILASRVGMSIPDIMHTYGLDKFRAFESQILREVCKESGLVIATGGGCVTKVENYKAIRQNGTVFWIQRDITKLPTEGRPLSINCSLQDMYEARRPLYAHFSDLQIHNNAAPDQAAENLLKAWKGE